jgi:hypothetical protein
MRNAAVGTSPFRIPAAIGWFPIGITVLTSSAPAMTSAAVQFRDQLDVAGAAAGLRPWFARSPGIRTLGSGTFRAEVDQRVPRVNRSSATATVGSAATTRQQERSTE